MEQGSAFFRCVGDGRQGIESTSVDIAALGADDARSRGFAQGHGEAIGAHAALLIGRNFADPDGAEAEEPERHEDGVVGFFVDADFDGRPHRIDQVDLCPQAAIALRVQGRHG